MGIPCHHRGGRTIKRFMMRMSTASSSASCGVFLRPPHACKSGSHLAVGLHHTGPNQGQDIIERKKEKKEGEKKKAFAHHHCITTANRHCHCRRRNIIETR